MRLLVADDERPARFVLRSLLEELGFASDSIEEIAGGRELVEAATSRKADCAFVDVRMPGTDGLAAIEEASPLCPNTRWIVVSSHAEFEYARRAIRLGVTEYLLKPVSLEELSACLERVGIGPEDPRDDAVLGPVIEYLKDNFNADVSVANAAELASLSPNYLSALFHRKTGGTISDYLAKLRAEAAAKLLREGASVAEAAEAVGYADARHFSKRFKEVMGYLPSELSPKS
jgi:Response regulator containing CheY-like receiver domain and AraC-type DNA-binding domain